jgi:hypothetical protein
MFSKQELDDIWENKPYGHFTPLKKSIKGKSKYKIKVTAHKVVEQELGSEESVVLAKDHVDAIEGLNLSRARESLRLKLGLPSWSNGVRYTFKCLGKV